MPVHQNRTTERKEKLHEAEAVQMQQTEAVRTQRAETIRSRRAVAFRDCLNEAELMALSALAAACNAADGTHYGVPDDADLFFLLEEQTVPPEETQLSQLSGIERRDRQDGKNPERTAKLTKAQLQTAQQSQGKELAAALCIYHMGDMIGGKPVDEIAAFTRPDLRRKGLFSFLLREADAVLRPAVRFSVYACLDTDAALQAFHAVYEQDECMMRLSLEAFTPPEMWKDDAERIEWEELNEDASGRIAFWRYGECCLRPLGSAVYCYGVLTYERFRAKGYGMRLLSAVLAQLKEEGAAEVMLEVSSENKTAIALYRRLGFKTAERLSYYHLPMQR